MKELRTEKIPIWENNKDAYLKAYRYSDGVRRENQPAVIICPGGGYLCISESESDPVAHRFAEKGYQPFVLNYSIMEQARFREGKPFKPVLELEKGLDLVHMNSDRYYVDRNKIIVIGFSAGGHLAASYCALSNMDHLKPAALILSYPLIDYKYLNNRWSSGTQDDPIDLYRLAMRKVFGTVLPSEEELDSLDVKNHISNRMPPVFIWHAKDDHVIDVKSSILLEQQLRKQGGQCKLYLPENGVHGEPFYNTEWFELVMKWLKGILNEE